MPEILNPYDNTVVAAVPEFSEQQVRDAISRAAAVQQTLADMPTHKRGAILNNIARILADQSEDIARLMAKESGKPMKYTRGEVSRGVDTFNIAADEARRLHGETIPMDAVAGGVGRIGYYIRVP